MTTAAPADGPCNGHDELCERRLDDVALATTHNSMSVPLPGWFSSMQEKPIAGQLQDGIRDRKSTRLNSSHANISYAVFFLNKKIIYFMIFLPAGIPAHLSHVTLAAGFFALDIVLRLCFGNSIRSTVAVVLFMYLALSTADG